MKRQSQLLVAFLLVLAYSISSQAYLSTMNTGEVTPAGRYRILGEVQYAGKPSGLNMTAGIDSGINESSDIRFTAGGGAVTFHTGLFYKWIPFPDMDNQPAMGVIAGGTWARYTGESYPGFSIAPIASKKFDTDYGFITAYATLPFGVVSGPTKNYFPLNLSVGGDWKPLDLEGWEFLVELGMDLNESANYVSAGAIYTLPE